MIFTLPAALGIIKSVLMNKYIVIGILLLGMFLGGYFYRGSVEKGRQARVIIKEVIRYVETTEKVRRYYDNIVIPDNIESILCGQISLHSRSIIPRDEGSKAK